MIAPLSANYNQSSIRSLARPTEQSGTQSGFLALIRGGKEWVLSRGKRAEQPAPAASVPFAKSAPSTKRSIVLRFDKEAWARVQPRDDEETVNDNSEASK